MSQSVQLDMEVLQRIKFLMEYDVMKTSSENILLEQVSMVRPKQNLVQPKTQTSQSLVGDKKTDWSKLPSMSSDPLHPKSAKWGDLPNVTLETVTQDVRKFMSDWRVAAVETMMTYAGVGIPVVLGANGFWMTLEIIQASKGNPDWWSLVFSILSTLTAGSQAAWLKPLYKLGGKGVGSLFEALDLLYQKAKLYQTGTKTATGVLDDLILLFKDLTPSLSKLMGIISAGIEWLSKTKLGQKIGDGLQMAKYFLSGTIKSMDDWFANLGKRTGYSPETSKKLGGAVRWGSVPAGIAGGAAGAKYFFGPPELKMPGLEYAPGTFVPQTSGYVPSPLLVSKK
jgi:hypothetical protein